MELILEKEKEANEVEGKLELNKKKIEMMKCLIY